MIFLSKKFATINVCNNDQITLTWNITGNGSFTHAYLSDEPVEIIENFVASDQEEYIRDLERLLEELIND